MVDCRWTIRVEPATSKIRLLLAAVQTEQDHDFVYVGHSHKYLNQS